MNITNTVLFFGGGEDNNKNSEKKSESTAADSMAATISTVNKTKSDLSKSWKKDGVSNGQQLKCMWEYPTEDIVNSQTTKQQLAYFRQFQVRPFTLVVSLEVSGEGYLPPGFLRTLLDTLGGFVSLRGCSMKFSDFTVKNSFGAMSELQSRAGSFYIEEAKKHWIRVAEGLAQNFVTKVFSKSLSDRQKMSRIRPVPRSFSSAKQLLEFDAADTIRRMLMQQHELLRQDNYVFHTKLYENSEDDRVVVLSSAHLAILKPTDRRFCYDTKLITPLNAIGGRSVSRNVVRIAVKGKSVQIPLLSSEEALKFHELLDKYIREFTPDMERPASKVALPNLFKQRHL